MRKASAIVTTHQNNTASRPIFYWVLAGLLVLALFTGGGSRADILSTPLLRLGATLMLGFALWSGGIRSFGKAGVAVWALILWAGFVALQLVPLPPSIWHGFSGHDVVLDASRLLGTENTWRPLTLVPSATWNALFSLTVPLAALVLAAQLGGRDLKRLLWVMLGLGLASALLGIMQLLGPPKGPLYLYQISSSGSATGFLANRNHQALLLAMLLPMLAVASHVLRIRGSETFFRNLAIVLAAIVVLLLLALGSRSGVVLAAIGIVASVWLVPTKALFASENRWAFIRNVIALIVTSTALVAAAIISQRSETITRIATGGEDDELRFRLWGPILEMAQSYLPFGSGIGSFAPVYQIDEARGDLFPAYLNHAHNDYVELLMTGGLVAVGFIVFIAFLWGRAAIVAARQTRSGAINYFQRLGVVLVFMAAAASVMDYPLRTPLMACVFAIAWVWALNGERFTESRGYSKRERSLHGN